MEKVKVVRIEVERWEGRISECDGVHVCETFGEANSLLRIWARTAPEDGTYDKCGFKVFFENGDTYEGRYDLTRKDFVSASIERQMVDYLRFCTGEGRPAHMEEKRYRDYLAAYIKQEKREGAKKMLETYDFGGAS